MKKFLLFIVLALMSFSLFAGGEIKVTYSGTPSGMKISVSGVNGKNGKQVNVYTTNNGNYRNQEFLTQFKVTGGSKTVNVDGVKCDEQVFVIVNQVEQADKPNYKGMHFRANVSKKRSNYSGSNCKRRGGNNDRGGNSGSVRIVDSVSISYCGYGAKAFLKKKGSQYTVAFNSEAKSGCNKIVFEAADKAYYLSNGLDFTPSRESLDEVEYGRGMSIKIYGHNGYKKETIYLTN